MRALTSARSFLLSWPAVLSLKTRVTAIVVGIVLVSVTLVAVSALYVMNRDVKTLVGQQQFLMITTLASALDQKFELRRAALRSLADGAPNATAQDYAAWQAYVVRHGALKAMFDNLSVFDAQGTLIANLNDTKLLGKFNAIKRSYLVQTLAKREGVISEPFEGQLTKKPIVVMTSPVLDGKGEVRFVFAATIDLSQQNFLGQFSTTKIGKTGYMFILSPDSILIEHPNRSRILQRSDAIGGRNLASARALAGYEGWTEAVNRSGVDSLYAFKRMQTTRWIVASAYPKKEALASIDRLETQIMWFALLLAALGGAAAWLMTRAQIRPMDHLQTTIEQIRKGAAHEPYGRYRKDEIGRLGLAFEALMTERLRFEARLRESETRLQTVTDNMPALISYVDREQRYRFANRAYTHWHGTDPATMVGQTAREYLGDDIYSKLEPYLQRALRGERVNFETGVPDGQGGIRYTNATYIPHIAESGEVLGAYAMVMDVTERKTLELQLHAQARQDALTGLPNRLEFMSRLQQAIVRADRLQKPLALLFLDLDGFKQVNDSHGHAAGDQLLQEIARRLLSCVRKSDTVARLGGDEFTVMVESLETDAYGGEAVARKIIDEIAKPIALGGGEVTVTTSVGVAFSDGQTVEELLATADTAMYAAKARGKNRFYIAPTDRLPPEGQGILI